MYQFKTPVPDYIDKESGCRATPGDIVVCNTDRLKKFTKGLYYRVKNIYELVHFCGSRKLMLEGVNGSVSSNNFNLIPKEDIRDIKLASVMDGTTFDVTTKETNARKIDIVDDKNYQLFELILNRISRDRNVLAYDNEYVDFSTMIDKISKGDRIFGVRSEDFKELRSMSIEQVFDLFIKTRKK